uniref:Uncharacterized protein n=1 Tax=Tetranychus urticae TaxID=32264 RepID=T1K6N2_TETUR
MEISHFLNLAFHAALVTEFINAHITVSAVPIGTCVAKLMKFKRFSALSGY